MKCDYFGCERDVPEGQVFCSSDCMIAADPNPAGIETPPGGYRIEDSIAYADAHHAKERRKRDAKADAARNTLTALDRFAMAALTGGMSNPLNGADVTAEEIAAGCYAVARAMMAERAK